MKFLKNLFTKKKKPMRWNKMPRNGLTLMEKYSQKHGFNDLLKSDVSVNIYATVTDIAKNACAYEVPTFYSFENEVYVILKLMGIPQTQLHLFREGIRSGKVKLIPRYKPMPTYPIIGFKFEIPTGSQVFPAEATPDLTDADIRDCLDILSKTGTGKFYLFDKNPPELIGDGIFSVLSLSNLKTCLNKAYSHYITIGSNKLDYNRAVIEYIATTPL